MQVPTSFIVPGWRLVFELQLTMHTGAQSDVASVAVTVVPADLTVTLGSPLQAPRHVHVHVRVCMHMHVDVYLHLRCMCIHIYILPRHCWMASLRIDRMHSFRSREVAGTIKI